MDINFQKIYDGPLKVKILIFTIIFIIFFYLGYRWNIDPLISNFQYDKQQENTLKNQLRSIISREVKLKRNIDKLPALQNQLSVLKNEITPSDELPTLLKEILKIGGNNHIYFSLVSPSEGVKSGKYDKVAIKLVAVSTYHQLADFISQIANMHKMVVVEDMSISNENKMDVLGPKLAEQANAEGLLTTELIFSVYQFPEISDHAK